MCGKKSVKDGVGLANKTCHDTGMDTSDFRPSETRESHDTAVSEPAIAHDCDSSHAGHALAHL